MGGLIEQHQTPETTSDAVRTIQLICATAVRFDESTMWLELDDGRTLGIPLAWYPRLMDGTPEQRRKVWITPVGLHWDELDKDITVAGLIAGRRDQTNYRSRNP